MSLPRAAIALFYLLLAAVATAGQEDTHAPLLYDVGGSSGWVPFGYSGNPETPGVLAEIADLVLARANVPYLKKYYPPKRAQQLFHEGKLDFDFTSAVWFANGDTGEQFIVSEPVFEVTEYFVTLPENVHRFQFPEAVKNQLVGTVSGYYYFDDDTFNRADFLSESELMLGLKMRRFPVAIMEHHAALYWARVHDVPINLASVHTRGQIVMRFQKRHQGLLVNIDAAIRALREEGVFQQVLDKYLNESFYATNADMSVGQRVVKQ